MTTDITPVIMPKWGLEMREGTIVSWMVHEGDTITPGQAIVDVETDKLANTYEAADGGLLRRIVAQEGETLPVKGLLAVLAPVTVPDADIDAFIASFVTPSADGADEDSGPQFDHATVDGIRVRYARRGDFASGRTPIVFIHGFGGDLGNWLFNVDAAAEHSPVLMLDLPGHGQSEIRLPGNSLGALAQWMAHFLNAVDVPRAHLVGHSMGGAVAAQLALDAPARVASVVLVNSAGLGDDINGNYTEGFVRAESRRDLKPVLEMLFADPALVSRQLVDDVLKYKRLDGVSALLAGLGDALFGGNRQSAQPARHLPASLPVQIVWGQADRVIAVAHAQQGPAHARVQVWDGAGHMAMLERANDFNTLLRQHVGT